MIGKAKSCVGGFSIFNYVIDDAKGIEILRNNLCGETPIELFQEMKIMQNLNQKATNKLISMILSPHVEDGEKLSLTQLQTMTNEFLKELEIDVENSQFIAFFHTEKRHRHIHILFNRVAENGKLLKDNHIGKLAQWAAHRVAKKNGLISAKQIRIDKIVETEQIQSGFKSLRKELYLKHLNVMAAKPKTMEKYLSEMLKQGVSFIPTINKQGILQGFRVRDMESHTEMKASEAHRNMGLKILLDSGLFFQDKNFDLSNAMVEINKFNIQKVQEETIIAEKRNTNFPSQNIFAFSPNIVDHTEDELKRKRKKKFRR
ncbi:relaxase/mobilization nuclease domain-containing protein [Kaistella polysaccharea]|uniref:relaxase/mobilization nuclease domain-containing protein n=1 Tax=Kaistella polysaccharea TaxID=2878534 RepID=UPI001CF42099|nr:relaxase/mobilization nuclease domain-containing protein [Kaistella polysaccharea]